MEDDESQIKEFELHRWNTEDGMIVYKDGQPDTADLVMCRRLLAQKPDPEPTLEGPEPKSEVPSSPETRPSPETRSSGSTLKWQGRTVQEE